MLRRERARAAPRDTEHDPTAAALARIRQAWRRPNWRVWLDCLLALGGVGVAVWRLAPRLAAVPDLGSMFSRLHWPWFGAAAALATASLFTYGELHRRFLVLGGARLPVRTVQAVTFVGNALAQTLPTAGAIAASAYAGAAFRRRGVDTTLAVWTVVNAALVSSVTLVVLAPIGIAADGLLPMPAAAGISGLLLLLAGGTVVLAGRPRSVGWGIALTYRITRLLPLARRARWLKVPPERRISAVTDRLARLRPRPGQWAALAGVATVSWLLDCGALGCCVLATAAQVHWPAVAIGYLAVQGSIALQITPGGSGLAETALFAALVTAGAPGDAAAIAVVLYRGITWFGLSVAGWLTFLRMAERNARPVPLR